MDEKELMNVNSEDILCFLNVDSKDYCAYSTSYDEDDKEEINFARVVRIDEQNCFLREIGEEEEAKVIEEYERYEEFMNSHDELDEMEAE